MLDAKSKIKAQVVAYRRFAPQLLVALRGAHAWFVPDMGEMGEIHGLG